QAREGRDRRLYDLGAIVRQALTNAAEREMLFVVLSACEPFHVTKNSPTTKPKNLFIRPSSCWYALSLSCSLPENQTKKVDGKCRAAQFLSYLSSSPKDSLSNSAINHLLFAKI